MREFTYMFESVKSEIDASSLSGFESVTGPETTWDRPYNSMEDAIRANDPFLHNPYQSLFWAGRAVKGLDTLARI